MFSPLKRPSSDKIKQLERKKKRMLKELPADKLLSWGSHSHMHAYAEVYFLVKYRKRALPFPLTNFFLYIWPLVGIYHNDLSITQSLI